MPPIFLHMSLARQAAERISNSLLAERAGEYLLGATSPDIRVLTRWERERTHFFDLNEVGHQDCVATMFSQHPHLADAGKLQPATAAWVAGFIGHISLDQLWIEQVYRPHFGQVSTLGGSNDANMMDRVLQYELDRRPREDVARTLAIREALAGCSLEIDAGFLDSETLRRWQEVAIDVARRPATWEHFRFQGGRHLRGSGLETDAAVDAFLERIPDVLEATIRHVSTAHVDAYLEQAVERATAIAARYLGVRA